MIKWILLFYNCYYFQSISYFLVYYGKFHKGHFAPTLVCLQTQEVLLLSFSSSSPRFPLPFAFPLICPPIPLSTSLRRFFPLRSLSLPLSLCPSLTHSFSFFLCVSRFSPHALASPPSEKEAASLTMSFLPTIAHYRRDRWDLNPLWWWREDVNFTWHGNASATTMSNREMERRSDIGEVCSRVSQRFREDLKRDSILISHSSCSVD